MTDKRAVGKNVINLKGQDTKVFDPDQIVFKEGEVGLVLELTVKDKAGNVKHHSVRRGESFVRGFIDTLFVQMGGVVTMRPHYAICTDGVERGYAMSVHAFRCPAAVGATYYGILVGTGTTAPTINDYAMETLITHGTGAGQLQYGAVAFGLPTATAVLSYFTVTRDFSNASGGSIVVNEIGLAVDMHPTNQVFSNTRPNNVFILTIRDVIGGGITVDDGETLTVNYRQQATV
jgi:hypothetical protein